MNAEPNMSVDPMEGGMSTMPASQTPTQDWFGTQGQMCTPEGGDGGSSQPEQNMSYNTPDGKPPAACWGFSTPFYSDGLMCWADSAQASSADGGFGGMCVDTSIDPHAQCTLGSGGLLDVVLSGPEGEAVDDMVRVAQETSAAIEWAAFGAELVLVNGKRVEVRGRSEIPFDRALCDAGEAEHHLEIVADFPGGARETRRLRVKMVRELVGGGEEIKFTIPLLKYKDILKKKAAASMAGNNYFEVDDAKLQIEVAGRAARNSTANVVGGHEFSQHIQAHFTAAISESFTISDSVQFKVTPKLKAGVTKRDAIYNQKPGDPTKKGYRFEVKFSVEFTFVYKISKEQSIPVGFEIGLTLVQLNLLKTGWETPKIGLLEGSVAAGWTGRVTTETFRFDGSVKVVGGITFKPNWPKILSELRGQFAAEFAELGAVLIPLAIVIGGVATIAVNLAILFDAWELKDIRDVTIPKLTAATTKGYMDGLRGIGGGAPKKAIADEASAYDAGLAEGANRRELILKDYCNGDLDIYQKKLDEQGGEWESQIRASTRDKLRREMFANRAEGYKHGLMTHLPLAEGMIIRDQMWAWRYIVSLDGPVSMGGSWLQLWLDHRTEDPDNPTLSSGDF